MSHVWLLNKGLKPLVFKYLIFAFLLTLFIFPVSAQESSLSVDVSQLVGTINPFVYGVNYGPWAIVPVDMWPMAEASGITYFRFPAGEYGDDHDVTEQQIDLFVTQAHQWHAEPSISVRLKQGTPDAAAKLVHYANIEKGYNIHYWGIGNEPDLYKTRDPNYSTFTLEQFNKDWRSIALAMRAVDPKILLIGPEISQYPPTVAGNTYNNVRREWVRSFLKANGDLVDIVSIHRYPFPVTKNDPPRTTAQLGASALEWDIIIPNLRQLIQDTVGHDLPIAITEINSEWSNSSGGEATPDSFYNAVWWADVLGRLIRSQVQIVNYFHMASYSSLGPLGLISRDDVRPTYYVYQLYRQFGSELFTSASLDKDVTVTAAKKEDGSLTLMVVNRGSDAKTLPISLKGFTPSGEAVVWLLDKDHKAENIGTQNLNTGKVSLLAESVTLYIIPASK